jgi:prophage antirepressor-like protein
MNELQIFKNENFGQIRVALLNNEPIFNLYDVCFDLGYTTKNSKGTIYLYKSRIEETCRALEIAGVDMASTKHIEITKDIDFENSWITEQNFYDLCLESHAKNARPFRKWVTGEVLPSIRKTGEYKPNNLISFNEKLEHLKLEQEGFKLLIDLLKPSQASTIKMLSDFNKSQGLSTTYLPTYTDEKVGMSATELLKKFGINMSSIKFNQLMLKQGFLEEKERNSTKGIKKYKALTEKGLRYGKNAVNSKGSEKETQPLYFEDVFQELLNFILPIKEVS